MTIDELQVLITANTSQLQKELSSVRRDLNNLDKNTQQISSKMPKSFGLMATTASAFGNIIANVVTRAFQGLGQAMGGAITRLDTLKNYPRVMQSMGYSAEDAQKSIRVLENRLLGLPTSLDFIVQKTQGLATVSPNLASATERALALNNALLAGGAPIDRVNSAFAQWNQMLGTGVADMQSWKILMEVMPGQLNQLAKSLLGSSGNAVKLQDAIVAGQVSMQQLADEVVKLNKQGISGFGSFEEQARNATGGIGTSIENVKIAITRGLAQIMDAIGQANISAFFGAIASAINAVVPYVVAFVKIIIMAVSWVRSLFGGGKTQAKAMTDQVNATSDAVGGVASGAGDVKDGLDGATGSAKKLKQQLAGFDEMNVLTDPNSGGGGGSGGGANVGGGTPMEFDMSGIDLNPLNKVDEKLKQILGVFRQIGDVAKMAWNSAPVQAFVGAIGSYVGFLIELYKQVGVALWENMVNTWTLIAPNVQLGLNNVLVLWTLFWEQVSVTIDTYGQTFIDRMVTLFTSVWQDAIEPIAVIVAQIWADLTSSLLSTWNKYGADILNGIAQFYIKTVEIFQSIWDNVIEPIIKPFLEMLSELWDKHLKFMVEQFMDFVGKLVVFALAIYNNVIAPIAKWLLEILKPAFAFVGQFIAGVFGTIFGTIASVVGNIFKVLGGLIDFLTGVFTGNWSKAWQGVQSIFGGIFGGIVAIAKAPLNLLIDLINSFISGINAIKIPDWVPGVGGKNLNISKIPKLAKGGVIDQATLAVVGESGKEAVMPLENNTGWISQLASQINKANGSDQPIQVVVKIGEDTIVRKIVDGIKDREYMTNQEVFV